MFKKNKGSCGKCLGLGVTTLLVERYCGLKRLITNLTPLSGVAKGSLCLESKQRQYSNLILEFDCSSVLTVVSDSLKQFNYKHTSNIF
jgi:hypothetical protein